MAENGYRKSTVEKVRTHTRACFEYAMDEDVIEKNPTRKLVMPNIRKKSCERFLSIDELRALLSQHRLENTWSCGFWPSAGCVRPRSSCCGSRISRGRNSESTRLSRSGRREKIGLARQRRLKATTTFLSRRISFARSQRGLRGARIAATRGRSYFLILTEARLVLAII